MNSVTRWGIVGILFLIFSAFTYAITCPDTASPDSGEGTGAVMICGEIYFCGNNTDGICPEDFENGLGERANCSRCPDADCRGVINGTVYDNSTGNPLPAANVSLYLSFESVSALTNLQGFYELNVPSGYQTIAASKQGYDTLVETVLVPNTNAGFVEKNFSLPLGVCHADCTNEFGRCNPSCEGFIGTDQLGVLDTCTYASTEVQQACANKLAGTEVFLREFSDTHSWFANCCEGAAFLKFHPKPEFTCVKGKTFVKVHKVVRLNGKPVSLVVAVCR